MNLLYSPVKPATSPYIFSNIYRTKVKLRYKHDFVLFNRQFPDLPSRTLQFVHLSYARFRNLSQAARERLRRTSIQRVECQRASYKPTSAERVPLRYMGSALPHGCRGKWARWRTSHAPVTFPGRERVRVREGGCAGAALQCCGGGGGVKNCHCGVSRAALQRSNSIPESGDTPEGAAHPHAAAPPAPPPDTPTPTPESGADSSRTPSSSNTWTHPTIH